MTKNTPAVFILSSFLLCSLNCTCYAIGKHNTPRFANNAHKDARLRNDTVPPAEVMEILSIIINSTNKFDVDAVANLYTPNAVVADDEPPYSWNGPTAGVQWVNAIEQVCKDNRLTKLKASIEAVNVYQQSADNVYIVVPVTYTGELPGKTSFYADGAFTFVLRMINGKWLVKEQVWMPRKAMR